MSTRSDAANGEDNEVRISLKESISHSSKRKRMLNALNLDAHLLKQNSGPLLSSTTPLPGGTDHNGGAAGPLRPVTDRQKIEANNTAATQPDNADVVIAKMMERTSKGDPIPCSLDEGSLFMESAVASREPSVHEETLQNEKSKGTPAPEEAQFEVNGVPVPGWTTGHDGIAEMTILSYAHYIDVISSMDNTYNASTKEYEMEFTFLGSPYRGCGLESSLARLEDYESDEIASLVEGGLIKNFNRFYAHSSTEPIDPSCVTNVWALMSLMQHNGCPTRLVEWTFNPNVALYFACENASYSGDDGEVWFVQPSALMEMQRRQFTDELTRINVTCPNFEQQQEALGWFEPAVDPKDLVQCLSKFDALSEESGPALNFFIPPRFDERMVNQCTVFSVVSSPLISADYVLSMYPGCVRRLIIPNFLKGVLHDTLDVMGVHERMLFPGLGGLSAALTRYFTRDARPSPEELAVLIRERAEGSYVYDAQTAVAGEPEEDPSKEGVLLEHAETSLVSAAQDSQEAMPHNSQQSRHSEVSGAEVADIPTQADPPSVPTRNNPRMPVATSVRCAISQPHDPHIESHEESEPAAALDSKHGAEQAELLQQNERKRVAAQQRIDALKRIEDIMRHDVGFEKNSAILAADGIVTCLQIAKVLIEYPELVISIESHTSCDQSEVFNCNDGCRMAELSQNRVDAIKNELEKTGCVNMLQCKGWGCEHPVVGSVSKVLVYPQDYESPVAQIDFTTSGALPRLAVATPVGSMSIASPNTVEEKHDSDNPAEPSGGVSAPESLRMMSLAFDAIEEDENDEEDKESDESGDFDDF